MHLLLLYHQPIYHRGSKVSPQPSNVLPSKELKLEIASSSTIYCCDCYETRHGVVFWVWACCLLYWVNNLKIEEWKKPKYAEVVAEARQCHFIITRLSMNTVWFDLHERQKMLCFLKHSEDEKPMQRKEEVHSGMPSRFCELSRGECPLLYLISHLYLSSAHTES